ncbi:MAG: DUF1080 domain-containing protein [Verrucomicrobiales bacterium]|nr:DUF1080 domain-containing protein [Verrucomicrobiales bacterium]
MRFNRLLISGSLLSLALLTAHAEDAKKAKAKPKKVYPTGYTDTPYLPGGKWRVHDDTRPRPEVVTPGKTAADAPSDAIVLFDGTNLDEWIMEEDGSPADWTIGEGYFEVPEGGVGGYLRTKREFGDVQLHIEFATPSEVENESQGRGNSGIFFLGSYELQVLDSYENKSYADGQASAIYGYKPPLVNASRPPGEWQTYDVIFEAPKWDAEGNLLKKARITVFHNGVVTHHYQDYLGPSGHKKVANYDTVQETGPLKLQNHNNPTRYRNIWIREMDYTAND